ncbi:MAG: hypothetical protein WKF30_15125 [Pyrinomonadaceae bacterium]
MKLTEALTIYLAVGAPFGAAQFFAARAQMKSGSFSKAIAYALFWPLVALRPGLSFTAHRETAVFSDEETQLDRRQLAGRRDFEAALVRVGELAQGAEHPEARRNFEVSLRTLLIAADQHFHLLVAFRRMSSEDAPIPKATELCRLAGREEEDLELAASCIHRRNTARVDARCAKSADELIEALAHFNEIAGDHHNSAVFSTLAAKLEFAQAKLTLCCLAVEMLSRLDDPAAAVRAFKLVDAACAKLRRLEGLGEDRQVNLVGSGDEQRSLPANHSTLAPAP